MVYDPRLNPSMLGGAYGMNPFQDGYDRASRNQANQYYAASPYGSGSMSNQVNPYRSMEDRGNSITQEQFRFGNYGNDTMGMSARANGYGQQLTKEQIDAMTGGRPMQAQDAMLRYPPGTVIPGLNGQPAPMQRPTPGNIPGGVPYIDVGNYPGGIQQWMKDKGYPQYGQQPYTGRSPQQIARDNAAKAAQPQAVDPIAARRAEIEKLRKGMVDSPENAGQNYRQQNRVQFLQRTNQNARLGAANPEFQQRANELNQVQDRLKAKNPPAGQNTAKLQTRARFLARQQNNARNRA